MTNKYDIFISYRRDGGYETANLIAKKLRRRGYRVFIDIDSLRMGKFDEQLQERIRNCEDILIILPENAIERCDDESDWLYKEVIWSIGKNKNIIPISLGDFTIPKGMEDLFKYQMLTTNRVESFDEFIILLQSRLKSKPVATNIRKYWNSFVHCFAKKSELENESLPLGINDEEFIAEKQIVRDNITGKTQYHNPSEGERQYKVNSSTLTIRFGNILDSDAEIIVSSDDNELSMGGGVSGAILVNGGEVILDDARKNIPAQLGDVVITTAGKLSQKYIFHCVTIDYADGQRKASEDKGLQEYIIRRSVDKCLRMMPLLGIDSIAFPAIGAGVAHFSLEEVAISMADIITDFLYTTSKQYQIEIYLYDRFHQKGVMDFIVFFENVAKSIDNHKNQKINMLNLEIEEPSPVTMSETPKTRPFGKMAASSPNDEHKVFVSYSRDNIEIARLFCEQMDNMGVSYWIDVNGKYSGNNFKEVLVDAIESSQVMLFLSSQESNQSPFVIKEISLAVSDNKTILPIKLDDAPYAKSIRFDLSDIDWIEFSKDKCEEAMEKFRYCLQLYLQ